MTPTRKKRLTVVLLILLGVGAAAAIAMSALKENLLYFVAPADVIAKKMPAGRQFRLGGLVEKGSVKRKDNSLEIAFVVTDGAAEVHVVYNDILPDLFREGQGVIAIGALNDKGVFVADEVLAKHDEKYMPPEVADALDKAGHPVAKENNAGTGQQP